MEWFDVPLFPLHAVLFPRQRLTLHVFEKRYRTMMEWCWMQNVPFGIVLIQSGREVGDRPVPHRVGTLARLQDMTLFSDGRMVVNVTGRQRFYIAYSAYDGPCLTARVRPLTDVEEPFREIESLVARVRAQFHHYCAARRATKTESWHIPRDPVRLSWVVAAALEMDQVEKQRILSTSRVSERLLYLAVRLDQALHETSGWEEGGQCG
ncbi:MAG: LON peptidase substrate-binding domain-containing protein [Alicyclobacillaceae bacterium]|nr:LON peptidase substrate-binding domain-containing protein [Alicyclobacillaceae bacterium]